MVDTCVSHLGAICQYGDDERVVNAVPIHEIEAPYGVPQNTYPLYCGARVVYHDAYMFLPLEVLGEEDPQVPEGGDCWESVLGPLVEVVATVYVSTREVGPVSVVEHYEFHLGQVG